MHIQKKFLILVVILVVASMGLSTWRYLTLLQKDQEQQQVVDGEQKAIELRQLTQVSVESLRDQLTFLISKEQMARHQGLSSSIEEALNQSLRESPFLATGLLRLDAKGTWNPAWARQRPKSMGKNMASTMSANGSDELVKNILASLSLDQKKINPTIFLRVEDSRQQPLFAMFTVLKDGTETVLGFALLPTTGLQAVTEAYVGSETEILVMNDQGFAMAYNEQAYIGFPMSTVHPAAEEILRQNDSLTHFSSQNRQRQSVLAATTQVQGTNLSVMVALKKTSMGTLGLKLVLSALLWTLAFLLFGFGFVLWALQPMEKALQYLLSQLTRIAHGQPVTSLPKGNYLLEPLKKVIPHLIPQEVGELPSFMKAAAHQQVENEKISAYMKVSAGLAQTLRDPIVSILAQSQLARSQKHHEEFKDFFETIEKEARSAREIIEQLLKWTGEEPHLKIRQNLAEVMTRTLDSLQTLLQTKNVKVQKDCSVDFPIQAHDRQLTTLLEELIKNSIEAMEGVEEKNLKIKSFINKNYFCLEIEDNGHGMDADQMIKSTEPFFTTKQKEDHRGLGLTIAKGIMTSLRGKLHCESLGLEKGMKVTLEFPGDPLWTSVLTPSPSVTAIPKIDKVDKAEKADTARNWSPLRRPKVQELHP